MTSFCGASFRPKTLGERWVVPRGIRLAQTAVSLPNTEPLTHCVRGEFTALIVKPYSLPTIFKPSLKVGLTNRVSFAATLPTVRYLRRRQTPNSCR